MRGGIPWMWGVALAGLSALCMLMVPVDGWAADAGSKESLYLRATTLYQAQKFQQAAPLLRRVLPLFAKAQQRERRGSRGWHQLTLAQVDIKARLAAIAWKGGQKQRACRRSAEVESATKTLPSAWKQWTAHTALPALVQASLQRRRGACARVPSTITIFVTPKGARLFYRQEGRWKAIVGRTLSTTRRDVRLRATAPGHQTRVFPRRKVARWTQVTWRLRLKPAAPEVRRRAPVRRPQVVVIRRPPARRIPKPLAPTPFYKTWWFWTVTGVVVVGGATAAILAVSVQPEFVLRGSSQGEPHQIW